MRFGSGFARIYHSERGRPGPDRPSAADAFAGHSWLYCRREFGYQRRRGVTLTPHLALRQPQTKPTSGRLFATAMYG
jgi:hypothetical protein